jgi:uncharacterized Zn-finger protein
MIASPESATLATKDAPARQSEPGAALARWDDDGGPDPRVRTALEPPYADRAPGLPSYQNEIGVGVIKIGAVEFHCVGALPPGDHPHIYLNMSGKASIRCPYCATNYVHDATLRWDTTVPPGCLYDAELEDRIDR